MDEALARYGTCTLRDVAGPAIHLARGGFAVRRTLAETAARAADSIAGDAILAPLYAPGGTPVPPGAVVTNPALADLLDLIAAGGAHAFYHGPVADQVALAVQQAGGYLTAADLNANRTVPADLAATDFRGATVWEFPAPTQGPAVLAALDLISSGPIEWERVLDATRQGLLVVGIDVTSIPGGGRRSAAAPRDTTYVAVIDGSGMGASMITSVFADFGSHLGIGILGGPIHNRAATFRALDQLPRPGKPPHTTIPAIITRDGELAYVLGLAGGYVQAQVQVQLIIRLLEESMSAQQAVDAPRMRWLFGGGIAIEPGHPLADRFPDAVGRSTGPEGFGAAQVAGTSQGRMEGGADHRRDGAVVVL
jgi:gamma-glutamyltranspeptidase/glutathione hydrolase